MSPRSDVSSLDIDIEKLSNFSFSDRPQSITGTQLSGRRSRPCSPAPRPQSRNFSLPSRPVSRSASMDTWNRGRRLSDENEKGSFRRAHSVSPEFNGPPSYAGSISLPPFAPKTMLHDPPPVNSSSSAESTQSKKRPLKSSRSMDILEAASHTHPWTESGSISTLFEAIREKKKQRPTTFAQRVFDAGKPDLLYEFRERKRLKDRSHGVLDLTTLERMNQHVLQQKLVEQVKAIGDKGAWMEIGIKSTLHDYCEAVRDMEYMETCALRGVKNDPFLLTTGNPLDCKLLEDAGLAFGNPLKAAAETPPARLEYTKRESFIQRGLRRHLMALVGGLAIIAPFLIMSLVSGQAIRLIVTCIFMAAFAMCATVGSELGPDRIALVTAAYAAALVIFVGTNPPSYSS
ncbi:hypothetical protein D0869_07936 [Hortaea werneckii]|uniref:DUF6594 domain-containing protein n=1 Tax=Hortaea werneckii TaxID=91943 RepID=A0A3M6WN02_HORWE|nr:hypothetical protein KC316_g14534 [Hortaea werneckii]RMX79937.1 hypothetical protein D0869_07936 [Hortaea werneckii]